MLLICSLTLFIFLESKSIISHHMTCYVTTVIYLFIVQEKINKKKLKSKIK